MIECDLHILKSPGREKWFNECIQSVKNEPINLHLIDGTHNHLGEGRFKGYSKGNCEFVSFVDDDDLIVPGVLEKLINLLKNNPNSVGAFSLHKRMDKQSSVFPDQTYKLLPKGEWKQKYYRYVHQLVVYRRDLLFKHVEKVKHERKFFDLYLNKLLAGYYSFVQLQEIGYYWRIHEDCLHKRKNLKAYSDF